MGEETRRIATVDYSVPLTVRVDLDTKEVLEVWLHLDSFQSSPPGRFVQVDEPGLGHDSVRAYFRDVFLDLDEVQGEFCDGEHPLADEAFAIADQVRITNPEFQVAFISGDPITKGRSYVRWTVPGYNGKTGTWASIAPGATEAVLNKVLDDCREEVRRLHGDDAAATVELDIATLEEGVVG